MDLPISPSPWRTEIVWNVSLPKVGNGFSRSPMAALSLLITSNKSADATLPTARRPRRKQRRTKSSRNSYSVNAEAPSSRPMLPPMSEIIWNERVRQSSWESPISLILLASIQNSRHVCIADVKIYHEVANNYFKLYLVVWIPIVKRFILWSMSNDANYKLILFVFYRNMPSVFDRGAVWQWLDGNSPTELLRLGTACRGM